MKLATTLPALQVQADMHKYKIADYDAEIDKLVERLTYLKEQRLAQAGALEMVVNRIKELTKG